jgi:hypothetical protein
MLPQNGMIASIVPISAAPGAAATAGGQARAAVLDGFAATVRAAILHTAGGRATAEGGEPADWEDIYQQAITVDQPGCTAASELACAARTWAELFEAPGAGAAAAAALEDVAYATARITVKVACLSDRLPGPAGPAAAMPVPAAAA